MTIQQRNLYLPAQNLSNLSVNVDDNRLGNDQTDITVDFTTSPATVTVKQGSVIEVNGNSYVIDTADEVFQMTNATDNYITFTDNPSTAFGSASGVGTFDSQKQGYYQAGNTTRTLRWYIDQTKELYDDNVFDQTIVSVYLDGFQVYGANSSQAIQFSQATIDMKSEFDLTSYFFQPKESGIYECTLCASPIFSSGGSQIHKMGFSINGIPPSWGTQTFVADSTYFSSLPAVNTNLQISKTYLAELKATDQLYGYMSTNIVEGGGIQGDNPGLNIIKPTTMTIRRIYNK